MSSLGDSPLPRQRHQRLVRPAFLPLALILLSSVPVAAQRTPSRVLPVAPPSRAESLLARGRLRAAEDALYAAVTAAPRSPSARGELGRYLAARARFTIAEVLFREALRFGADTPSVAQALAAMAPYTPEIDRRLIPGARLPAAEAARESARLAVHTSAVAPASAAAPTAVPFAFARSEGLLGSFMLRGSSGSRRAVLDLRASGLSVARPDDAALKPRSFGARGPGAPLLIDTLWIGNEVLRGVEARVDPNVPEGQVRVGIDLLWSLQPIFDEMNGTMTLSAPGTVRRIGRSAVQIPFSLGFPGMWLIPTVGESPVALSSTRAQALLGKSRWWWDGSQSTLIVER